MPRVEIPLIGPNYTNRQRPLSAQKAINMWPEINPEARNQVCLHNTAGTRTFATLEGIDRGMTDFNNLMYAVNGQTLYSIDADGVNKALGTISGKGRCVMANDSTQLIITTGETPYRYTVDGGVEAITDPDLTNPTSVAYLNNQFIFDNNNGTWGEFVTSSIEEGLAIDALDFANAESHPDDIVRVMAFRQLVYFFGSHSVEPWQNTGVGNPPFARLNSGVQPYGLAGTHGVVATDEYMYFLDTKRVPRRSNGLNFVAIGNPALGVEFAKYSRIDDVIAYEFTQDQQQFVVFTFPTANRSWCFHEPSGSWFQLTHGVGDDRHRASSMLNIYGLNYCADHTSGKIYEYSLDIFSDDGEPIIKQRDTAVIHGGLFGVPGKRLYFDEVEFIIVGGETEVAGTGLGPQPVQPFVPLTNCNDIYQIGTLVPDLHVAGQDTVTGVWSGDMIYGTGGVQDDRLDTIYTTNEDGDYTQYPGYTSAFTGLAQVFYPDCQWYAYAGPLLESWFAASTCEYTDTGWTKTAGATAVTDTVGIDSAQANWSSTITDNDAAQTGQVSKASGSNTISGVDVPFVYVGIFYKDATATNWTRFSVGQSVSGAKYTRVMFSQATGAAYVMTTSDTSNGAVSVRDCGDWWEVYIQSETTSSGATGTDNRGEANHFPAWNADGTETQDVTALGSLRMGESRIYLNELYEVFAGAVDPQVGAQPASVLNKTEISIPIANHDNTEGGYYIEWRPMYASSDITRNVEILSLNGSAGLLYYDYTNQLLTSTDGTNTATVPLTLTADTKYRCGVIWGDYLRVGVDAEWGSNVAYDGSFPTSTLFELFKDCEAVNYWRELRGFQIPYLDAFNEIQTLMLGGGTGSTLPAPPPADPQTEIVAPFWENTGNWIDLNNLTQTTFEGLFGTVVEGADFNAVYAVDKAALVNTSDDGNRLQIQDTIDCDNAYLAITDASGNVVDSMIYAGVPNGESVQIPTGANYYVVITSDTGNARIKKWDVTSTPISTEGSVSWDSFFGQPFSLGTFFGNVTKIIPAEGVSIRFTIPATASSYKVSLSSLETPSNPGIREGAVNQEVLNFSDGATYTWGLGGGIDGGVNLAGQDIDLIPGETYFFNVRCANPLASNNYITIQASSLSA